MERLKRYNLDIHICGDRNSDSKTDHDATFMHMKEDHMKNGQLKPGYNTDIGRRENMPYDAEKDEYTCAQGKKLTAVGTKIRKSETGYAQEVTIYECKDCKNCPFKEKCIRQKKTDKTPLEDRVKRLNVSKYFVAQREAMEKKIATEEGILLRVNRSNQSEGVFAMIKEDMNFRRFMMRGKRNVTVEWHLVSMAYNILKLHNKIQNGRLGRYLITTVFAQFAKKRGCLSMTISDHFETAPILMELIIRRP